MSQRYVNIEDETFPSFLAESMSSNLSEALDNCTITSNLGLPVAASTVAKGRTAFERLSDVQASYLENEKLPVTTDLFTLGHSGGDRNGKFVLSFKDDMEYLDTFLGAKNQAQNADVMDKSSKESSRLVLDSLPNERNDGFSNGLVSDAKLGKVYSTPSSLKDAEKAECGSPGDEIRLSVASFLENEKLISIASLDASSSDEELNDEEFYDDELESYFKKLRPPGMQRGVIEGQEIQEPKRASFTVERINADISC